MRSALAPPVRPVAITGAGVATSIGQDLDSFWAGLVTGASGISEIEGFPVDDLRVTRGGEIKKLRRELPVGPARAAGRAPAAIRCRTSRFLIHAAREALETAGLRGVLPEPERIGVVIGTALGGIDEASRASRSSSEPVNESSTGSSLTRPTRRSELSLSGGSSKV